MCTVLWKDIPVLALFSFFLFILFIFLALFSKKNLLCIQHIFMDNLLGIGHCDWHQVKSVNEKQVLPFKNRQREALVGTFQLHFFMLMFQEFGVKESSKTALLKMYEPTQSIKEKKNFLGNINIKANYCICTQDFSTQKPGTEREKTWLYKS